MTKEKKKQLTFLIHFYIYYESDIKTFIKQLINKWSEANYKQDIL